MLNGFFHVVLFFRIFTVRCTIVKMSQAQFQPKIKEFNHIGSCLPAYGSDHDRGSDHIMQTVATQLIIIVGRNYFYFISALSESEVLYVQEYALQLTH